MLRRTIRRSERSCSDRVGGSAGCSLRTVCKTVALCCLLLSGLASCSREIEYEELDTLQKEQVSVVIEAATGPQEDGTTAIRVRRIDERGDVVVFDASVANGGEALTLDNIRPDLRSPSDLRLCLNGAEQPDVSVRMNVLVRFVASNERNCTR